MRVCKTIADMRQVAADLKSRGDLGFVPTMGALHAGHMALVELAVRENASVAASIFVNPTQFGDPEDFDKYPNTLDADLTTLEQAGVEAVFLPDVSVIYPPGDETIVETTRLANMLHGEVRPGHFRGVTTVVTRLFNIVQPHRAYFGKKGLPAACGDPAYGERPPYPGGDPWRGNGPGR
ncbi:4-phosphopantoate--beta-alanine ligase [Amaricoccus tamworthensis]|uniref:4-phosphopantoate--beta-alanine ligase n=1 Tax=Amaricoccus tamworthensis TaxID=57002 RepID=UPI003C7A0ED4